MSTIREVRMYGPQNNSADGFMSRSIILTFGIDEYNVLIDWC